MAQHCYVLLTFVGALGDFGLNEDQRVKTRAALRELNQHEKQVQRERQQPNLLTQVRWSLKGDKCIVEAELPDDVSKSGIVDELVKGLGLTRELLNSALEITVYLDAGNVREYLQANYKEWHRSLPAMSERDK